MLLRRLYMMAWLWWPGHERYNALLKVAGLCQISVLNPKVQLPTTLIPRCQGASIIGAITYICPFYLIVRLVQCEETLENGELIVRTSQGAGKDEMSLTDETELRCSTPR